MRRRRRRSTTETLKPKRLTGVYEFTHEQAAQVADLEQALRRDLGDSVKAEMSDLILTGDEATNSHEPDGFLTKLAAETAPTVEAAYADYAGSHAGAVDGIHASMETEVSFSVVGVASYRHAATVYQAGSGESGSEALKRRGMACMASSPSFRRSRSTIQDGNIFHAAGPNGGGANLRGDSVAAVWPTLEIIRDIYTKASRRASSPDVGDAVGCGDRVPGRSLQAAFLQGVLMDFTATAAPQDVGAAVGEVRGLLTRLRIQNRDANARLFMGEGATLPVTAGAVVEPGSGSLSKYSPTTAPVPSGGGRGRPAVIAPVT